MMKKNTERNISKVFSALFFIVFGAALLLIPVEGEISVKIIVKAVIPLTCFIMAAAVFLLNSEKRLYSPEKDPLPLFEKHIRNAYDKHSCENVSRKPIEQELDPACNIILNKKKYVDGINRLIDSTGASRAEFEQDYYSGEYFRSLRSMLNISRKFVTYSDTNGNQFIIESRKIIGAYPLIENVDMHNNGIMCGTVQNFYVVVVTPDITYKFALAEYMDRPVMDAFRRIAPYLHYECELYSYPFHFSAV